MEFEKKLAIPMEVKQMYPLSESLAKRVADRNRRIREVLDGNDPRMLVIVGPCSADREDSVLDYMRRLAEVQKKTEEQLILIPRVYTNKPRSSGEGYMGLLHQPDPHEKPDLLKGIIATRELHMRVIRETGFVSADEMLYPENQKYTDDLLGYVSVGARSVENQQHRLTASGLDIPVGMKNPLSGDLHAMMNAVHAARKGHVFLYRGWQVSSEGNPYAHAILRGYQESSGRYVSNFDPETLRWVGEAYRSFSMPRPNVIVDLSHGNSGKQPQKQADNLWQLLRYQEEDPQLYRNVKGIMLESYLVEGAQSPDGSVYGQSITDPCLGWEQTESLLQELADNVRRKR